MSQSDFAAREAALDRINDDPAWAQRAYGAGTRAPDHREKLEELGKRLEEAMARVDAAAAPLMERWGIR